MNRLRTFIFVGLLGLGDYSTAAEPAAAPAKPVQKITPGKVIIPTDRMRRLWGELISLDLTTRTGKFRFEENDDVMEFVVMPYAELLHHATNGDLQDFTPGERALFRLHEDENGVWRYLTYIQDEMNFLNNHTEWFFIDKIDRDAGRLTTHQAKYDESFIRTPVVEIDVDADTKYWREGQPIRFDDLKVGDKVQTKTRSTDAGKRRIAWHVFLDGASLLKMQAEQKPVHATRLKAEGMPGYADAIGSDTAEGQTVELTLFGEVDEFAKKLKAGWKGKLAPAGVDRKPTAEPVDVTSTAAKMAGKLCKVTVQTSAPLPKGIEPTALIRLWIPQTFE